MLEKKTYLLSQATMFLSNSLFGMIIIWWLQTQTGKSSLVGLTNAIFSITAALSIFTVQLLISIPSREPVKHPYWFKLSCYSF